MFPSRGWPLSCQRESASCRLFSLRLLRSFRDLSDGFWSANYSPTKRSFEQGASTKWIDASERARFCWWDISANVSHESSNVKHAGLMTSTVSQTPPGHINWFSCKSPKPPKFQSTWEITLKIVCPWYSLLLPLYVLHGWKEFPSGLKGHLLLQRFAVTKQPEVICFPKEWVIFRDVNDSDRWTVEQKISSDAVRQSCFKRLDTLFWPNLKIDFLLSFAEKAMS